MLNNPSTIKVEQSPSMEQIDSAEILIEEVLEPISEADVTVEIIPEEIAAELEDRTVVDSTQVNSEFTTNLEPEVIDEPLVREVSTIDSASIINDVRQEAIASFGTASSPDLDIDVNALNSLKDTVEARASLTFAPPVSGIFTQAGAEDDLLFGSPNDDFLFAGEGKDIVVGLSGRDLIFGEGGDDFLIGGADNDVVDGGTGNDLIFGDDSRTAPINGGADVIRGGDGLDVVFAGGNNDTVFGDNDDDVIYGEDGNDILSGGNGSDLLNGGEGSDRLFGDSDNDLLDGGDGNDRLNAEDGDDLIIGGMGSDVIFGGRGNDTISGVDATQGNPGFTDVDTLQGGEGRDLFQLGDADNFYYSDIQVFFPNETSGFLSYASIEDFASGEDLIQLNGSAEQYILQSTEDNPVFNENNLPTGTAIIRHGGAILEDDEPTDLPVPVESFNLDSTDESLVIEPSISFEPVDTIELIAIVENVDPSQLSLTDSSQFTFV